MQLLIKFAQQKNSKNNKDKPMKEDKPKKEDNT